MIKKINAKFDGSERVVPENEFKKAVIIIAELMRIRTFSLRLLYRNVVRPSANAIYIIPPNIPNFVNRLP